MGAGVERDMGVAEQAGMGMREGLAVKFVVFRSITPLPPTPPESSGNIELSMAGEVVVPGTKANSVGAEAHSAASELSNTNA